MLQITQIRLDYGSLKKENRYRITDNSNPVFSWTVLSDGTNVTQEAFAVRVWSGEEVLWDTGWQRSRETEIVYAGRELPLERRIYVSVTVRDSRGLCSEAFTEYFFRSSLKELEPCWITSSEDKGNQALYFKKDFICWKKVAHAVVYACGLGYHELYLNGKRIDRAVLDPAFSDYTRHCYVTVIPEAEEFLEEQNCISAIVGQGWRRVGNEADYYWKPIKFCGSPQLMMALHLEYEDSSTEIVSTDDTWLWGEGPIVFSHLFDGETFDAGRRDPDWNLFGAALEGLAPARCVEEPGGKLEPMTLEPIQEQGVYQARTVTPIGPDSCVADFGQNIAGVCRLRIPDGLKRGQQIRIQFVEELDEDGSGYLPSLRKAKSTDTYIAAGDDRDLAAWTPSFTYHGFRYACIQGLGMIDPKSITAVSRYTDVAKDSFFTCGSGLLNAIQTCIVQTEKANIQSILTDCPQRDERLGWMNDATVRFGLTPYGFDIGRLFPKVVEDILDTQWEDGSITCTAPYVLGNRPADPVCSSFLIAGQQAWLHTGNVSIIRKAYEGFASWEAKLGELASDHIVEYTAYGDWASPIYACVGGEGNIDATLSACTPGSLLSTGFYYYNAVLLREFAELLGKQEDAAYYKELAGQIKKAMLEKWWDDEKAVMATGSQGSQSFALWLGIVPEERRAAAAKHIHEDLVRSEYHFTTGNICTRYMLEMLTEYGYVEDAWTLMTREDYPSIGYMLQNEATTIWERFELKKNNGMNSHNHPMYGAVGYWFYAYLAGIKPVGKGCSKLVIKPFFPKRLLSVNAKVETVRGDIVVRWVRRYGKVYLYVTLPFSTEAEIIFAGRSYQVGSGFHRYEVDEGVFDDTIEEENKL